jgi:hypothetical protein
MPKQEVSPFITNAQFTDWIANLKTKIHVAKNKLVFSLNSQILELYREIGKEITERQQTSQR